MVMESQQTKRKMETNMFLRNIETPFWNTFGSIFDSMGHFACQVKQGTIFGKC